jgi:hypothetical protein
VYVQKLPSGTGVMGTVYHERVLAFVVTLLARVDDTLSSMAPLAFSLLHLALQLD